jgi:acyl dehydratase
VILQFKGAHTSVIDYYSTGSIPAIPGVPAVDKTRVLDGQRHIQIFKPLPPTSAGKDFELRITCLGVEDKGKAGMVTETEALLVDTKTNTTYCRILRQSFAVGQGGWGGPKRLLKERTYTVPGDRKPDAVYTQATTAETAHVYRLNGDYNPLHCNDAVAKKAGFKGIILHGLCTWNMSAHALLRTFANGDGTRLKEFQARFKKVVYPGDELRVEMWRTGRTEAGGEEVLFRTMVGGDEVLSNGRAVLAAEGEKSRL